MNGELDVCDGLMKRLEKVGRVDVTWALDGGANFFVAGVWSHWSVAKPPTFELHYLCWHFEAVKGPCKLLSSI